MIPNFFDSIATFTLDTFFGVFNFLLGFLPASDGFDQVTMQAFTETAYQLRVLNVFFPLQTLFQIISIVISVQITLWTIQIVLKGVYFVRGADSKTDNLNIT